MATPIEDVPEVVTLDVGGKLFKTRSSTIMKSGFFQRLLNGSWKERITEGEYNAIFVDSNPEIFAYVLDFLRGSLVIPTDNDYLIAKIKEAADYFDIPFLSAAVKSKEDDNNLVPVLFNYRQDAPDNGQEKYICRIGRKLIREAKENGLHELLLFCDANYERNIESIESIVYNKGRVLDKKTIIPLVILLDIYTYDCVQPMPDVSRIEFEHALVAALNLAHRMGAKLEIVKSLMQIAQTYRIHDGDLSLPRARTRVHVRYGNGSSAAAGES